jgi:hypothetical protein
MNGDAEAPDKLYVNFPGTAALGMTAPTQGNINTPVCDKPPSATPDPRDSAG